MGLRGGHCRLINAESPGEIDIYTHTQRHTHTPSMYYHFRYVKICKHLMYHTLEIFKVFFFLNSDTEFLLFQSSIYLIVVIGIGG